MCQTCDTETFSIQVHKDCKPVESGGACSLLTARHRKRHQTYAKTLPEGWLIDHLSYAVTSKHICRICKEAFQAGDRCVDICLRAYSPAVIKAALNVGE